MRDKNELIKHTSDDVIFVRLCSPPFGPGEEDECGVPQNSLKGGGGGVFLCSFFVCECRSKTSGTSGTTRYRGTIITTQ